MQKIFTNLVAASLMLGTVGATAQTQIWPTADTNTINASQFKGAASLFTITRTDTVVPAGHKGWYTKGLVSANAAKKDSAVWQWNTNGTSRGAYGGGSLIVSPTVANGAVTFDSDWLDNKGVALPNGDGIGQAPSPNAGELVSPIIDARGFSNVTLRFNQVFRNFSAATYVSWSEDSGRTWKPNVRLNADIAANNLTATNAVANVKLAGSVGTSGFRVKFIFNGDYYYWSVDDVKLITINQDLKVNTFFAIAPSYITQKNQVEDMKFLLDIANAGNTATNVKVKLFVYRIDAAGVTQIYTDSLSYGTVRNDTTIENRLLPGKLLASALTPGQYYGRYRIASDSVDQNPVNDTLGFGFMVSDSLFWKESSSSSITRPSDAYWTVAGEPRAWRTGNYYYVKRGQGQTITSLTVRLGDPSLIKGQRVSGGLYEWVDANADAIVQPGERVLVAFGDTLIPQTQGVGAIWLTLALKDINTQKWFYPSNDKQYLAMVEFDPTNATMHMQIGFNRGLHDYGATVYMTDSLYRAGVSGFRPSFAPILGKKVDTDWSTIAFGYGLVPTVRLMMYPFIINTTTQLTVDHKIEVFPNPAKEVTTLEIDFPTTVSAMGVHILDNNGRMVQEQLFYNVQKGYFSLNVADLASGTYMVRIMTPDGTRMKKLVVAK